MDGTMTKQICLHYSVLSYTKKYLSTALEPRPQVSTKQTHCNEKAQLEFTHKVTRNYGQSYRYLGSTGGPTHSWLVIMQ